MHINKNDNLMKTKISGIAILLLVIAASSMAQVKLGIRGGINASRMKSDTREIITPHPTDDSYYRLTVPKYAMVGYHVGLIGQIQLFNFFIQPEALYMVTRNDINIYDLNSADPTDADPVTWQMNRIDFPVLLGLKLSAFKIGVGPVFTFVISDDSDLKRITQYDMQLNKATVGFQAGIGFDIKKFTIDLKYEGSLSDWSDDINLGNNERLDFNTRLNQIILSAGIFF
jgi:hypothetical protein